MKRATSIFFAAVMIGTFTSTAFDARAETAQTLFDEAKQLIQQGNWQDACPKLARSQQLEPRPTTLYRLAECYEHVGRTASARTAYLGAASAASAAGEAKRAEYAQERAKRLETMTPFLVVTVSQKPLNVFRDGERVDETQFGVRVPVDPGEHVVVAEAPGKQTFTATVFILDAATTVLTIPPLLDASAAAKLAPAQETSAARPSNTAFVATPQPQDNRALRGWGLGVLGIGVASIGVGGVLALTAPDTGDGCKGVCATGTGLMIGGAVFAATGLALFLASFGDGGQPRTSGAPFVVRF